MQAGFVGRGQANVWYTGTLLAGHRQKEYYSMVDPLVFVPHATQAGETIRV